MFVRRALGLVVVALVTSSAFALTDEEVFRDFRFNLINPGARSLALGGAFISLADDATAAQANPAGLSFLGKPELFAEYRYVDNESRASILRETLPPDIDTLVATGTDLEDRSSPTFISLVYPLGRWTFGVSRQEVLNTKNSTVSSFAFSFPSPPGVFLVQGSGSIDVRATNYNASAGFEVSDRFAVGGSVAYSALRVRSEVTNFIVDTGGNVADRQILEPTLDLRTSIHEQDHDYAFNLGVIYSPYETFHLAAVYRRAPKFSVRENIDPEGPDADDDGFPDSGIDTLETRGIVGCPTPTLACSFANTFHLPDSYGISESWQPRETLTISQDFERVEYSDLLEGYVPGVNILTGADARFTVKDAYEYHLGVEYILKMRAPIALRAGLFTEHDSTIRAVSTGTNAFATPASFPGRRRDTQVHVTGGAGVVWGQSRYKLDAAIDRGGSDNEYLVSFIFRGR